MNATNYNRPYTLQCLDYESESRFSRKNVVFKFDQQVTACRC